VKLLLDENLSPRLVAAVDDLYPGSRHIEDCGLISAPDDDIWNYARTNGFAIVTKDSDYSERSVLEGFPPKVIWLRIGNCTTKRALAALRNHAEQIDRFGGSGTESCLVLSIPPFKDVKSATH
jgi:predicted nuclease of predicted toxin-antitoxin system